MTMGWLRLVGSIKLQASFTEYSLFCKALLQKRPVISSILLAEATSYDNMRCVWYALRAIRVTDSKVMSRIELGHVTKSCRYPIWVSYIWVMPHDESCRTYYVCCALWVTRVSDSSNRRGMTQSYMWHYSFHVVIRFMGDRHRFCGRCKCVLLCEWFELYTWYDPIICVTRLIYRWQE